MSGADDGEIYDDGTAIKNISVSGVAQKAAMFDSKSGKTTPPVLRKFRNTQAENAGNIPKNSSSSPGTTSPSNPPWKRVVNGSPTSKPDISPKTSKSPPGIPAKTSKPLDKPPSSIANKPLSPKSEMKSSNIPVERPSATPETNKDINHNEQTKLGFGTIQASKRRSVTDILKNFQSESDSGSVITTNVKPLKDSTSVFNNESVPSTEQNKPDKPNVVQKISIQEKIAALQKKDSVGVSPAGSPVKRTSVKLTVITRKKDGKKFKRVNMKKFDFSSEEPPSKPPKLSDVDLTDVKSQYNQILLNYGKKTLDNGDEELYDDIGNIRPVSVILPMTEEDELYDDTGNILAPPPPIDEEIYDDCGVAESEELYEFLDEKGEKEDEQISGGSVTSKGKEKDRETLERKKKEEKERKDQEKREKEEKKRREKEEKDRQKEIKKKEKEEKDRLSKLKVDGTERQIGEGIVREDCHGVKLDLPVKKDEKVLIMRMDKNPKGKWLVTNSEKKWGYVDADNVEVATPTIRQWMNNQDSYVSPDDVAENGTGVMEDIYEEL